MLKLQLTVDRNTISQLQQNVDNLQQNLDNAATITELRGQMKEVLGQVSGQVTKILDEVQNNSGRLSHDGLSKTVGQIVATEVSRVGLNQSDTSDCDQRVASIVATIVARVAQAVERKDFASLNPSTPEPQYLRSGSSQPSSPAAERKRPDWSRNHMKLLFRLTEGGRRGLWPLFY